MNADLGLQPASALVAALRRKEISSRELLQHYLDRIDEYEPAIHALVAIDSRAQAFAAAADDATARGDATGPLHGLPMTVKDSIETGGLRTTAAVPFLADHVPGSDAPAVARLRAAGAVVFGKTNLPEMAGDCQTYNSMFPTTNNPWNLARTPGGSSGGATAAVAAGLTGLELGSDLGGSVRIPAHWTGVYGFKPTYGIVPLRGHIPPPPGILSRADIMTLGPIARSAGDIDLALGVLAGASDGDEVAWRVELPPPRRSSFGEYRVAACLDDDRWPVDSAVRDVLERAVDALRGAGVTVEERRMPVDLADALEVAQALTQGSISHALPPEMFDELVARARSAAADDHSPPVQWARNITQRVRDFNNVNERRAVHRAQWAAFFESYDVFLAPVMRTTAIPHDHLPSVDDRTVTVNGRKVPYGEQFMWLQPIGAVYLPALSAPVGVAADGLPVGMQVIGPYCEDRTVVDFASRMADVVGGYEVPPLVAPMPGGAPSTPSPTP